MKLAPHATNTLPLPPKRRHRRKYSLPGTEPPPRHLLGPKPDLKDADSSEIDKSVKSDISLSERVSTSDLSIADSGIMSTSEPAESLSLTVPCLPEAVHARPLRHTARPLSLDLSYRSEQTDSKTSTDSIMNTSSSTNSLPLPPRRGRDRLYSLRGDEPPPRSSLGPKPPTFEVLGADPESSGENEASKTSLEVIPIIHVTEDAERPAESDTAKDTEDSCSLDDVFIENMESDAREINIDALRDTQMRFMDDASLELTDVEARIIIMGPLDSDVDSQRSVQVERYDTDSQLDIHSESSMDTVATAIEVRKRSKTIDSADALSAADEDACMARAPSYESLNTYETLSTEGKLSVIDQSYPKLAKDLKNKMSRESTQKLSKNIAAEISDFFKSSASKLKPPCLDQVKKDLAAKKLKMSDCDEGECSTKIPPRLIPRSPYITPVPVFEKTSPRKAPSTKQPPFYAWNINSKNAAVCTTLSTSSGYRSSANDESKTLKDIENNTRKILDINRRSTGAHTRMSPTKSTEKTTKSAFAVELGVKPLRDPKMSPQSNDSKLRTPNPGVMLSKGRIVSLARPSPNRLLVPRASSRSRSRGNSLQIEPFKFPTKQVPKINIPLPSPHITVAKVKTQLPCDFTPSKACESIARAIAFQESYSLPNVTVPIEPSSKKSWVKKWKSLMHDVFKKHPTEFYMDYVPPCSNIKRSNTWPPKTYNADNSSIHTTFLN